MAGSNRYERPGLAPALFALAAGAICFFMYYAFIVKYFERGGYVEDSGWFAYLMASCDPWLQNPRSTTDFSFYAHHISPILYLWSIVFTGLFGFSGITNLAIFMGAGAVLALLPLVWLALAGSGTRRYRFVTIAIGTVFALTNIGLLRTLFYPHYELVMVGLTGILFVSLYLRRFVVSLCIVLVMALVREDGGLFAGYTVVVYWAMIRGFRFGADRIAILALFATAIILSALSLFIQHRFFPEFGTFRGNYAGRHFDHVTAEFIGRRLYFALTNFGVAPAVAVSVALAFFNKAYFYPLLFMSPLIALQLASVRDFIGKFELHYALPFSIITLFILLFFLIEGAKHTSGRAVTALIVVLLAINHIPDGQWLRFATEMPKFNVWESQRYVMDAVTSRTPPVCGSVGVVALAPDAFAKQHFIKSAIPEECTTLILFNKDLDYARIRRAMDASAFRLAERMNMIEVYERQD